MYSPTHFKQHDTEAMFELIREFPLATLVIRTAKGIAVNHIPMLLSTGSGDDIRLSGHIPRSNPVWRDHVAGSMAIAVFHGPQAYITPSWYASKKQHGRVVPTWNYTTVHAHGHPAFMHDDRWLMSHLDQLTKQLESSFDHPWAVSDAPSDFTDKLITHLVGIEIPVRELVGKWKVSQNRPAEDRAGVAEGLKSDRDSGRQLMSDLVAGDEG